MSVGIKSEYTATVGPYIISRGWIQGLTASAWYTVTERRYYQDGDTYQHWLGQFTSQGDAVRFCLGRNK